jgi:hypothetical protein
MKFYYIDITFKIKVSVVIPIVDFSLMQGRIQGGGGGGRTRKIVIFHTKYPKNVRAPHRSAQFF